MEDVLKNIYTSLSDKYNLGTEDNFRRAMQKEETAKALYDSATKNGYNLGDYDTYKSQIGLGGQPQQPQNTPPKVKQAAPQGDTEKVPAPAAPKKVVPVAGVTEQDLADARKANDTGVDIDSQNRVVQYSGDDEYRYDVSGGTPRLDLVNGEAYSPTPAPEVVTVPNYSKAPEFSVGESWKYTKTINNIDTSNPINKAALNAGKYAPSITSSEVAAIENNTDYNDLLRQAKELEAKYKNGEGLKTAQFEHDAQLIATIHNRMVDLEYGINGNVTPGEKNYRMYSDVMRKQNKYFSEYDRLLKNGNNLKAYNPFFTLPDKVEAKREWDRKNGEEKPDNYYYHLALKDKDFADRVHAYGLALAKQTGMSWKEAKNWAAAMSDRAEEEYKEKRAKDYAESGWYWTAGLFDSTPVNIAKGGMRLLGFNETVDQFQDVLDRSMRYAGRGANAVRGVVGFVPDVAVMAVTNGAGGWIARGLGSAFELGEAGTAFLAGGAGFGLFNVSSTMAEGFSRGELPDGATLAGESAKGFLLGGGSAAVSRLIYGIAPAATGRFTNYAIRGLGKAGEFSVFAGAQTVEELLAGHDIDALTIVLNNGALIFSMGAGRHISTSVRAKASGKRGKPIGIKRDVSTGTIEQMKALGYENLAKEMEAHNASVFRGKESAGYSEEALKELNQLQEDMKAKGVSWSTYAEVLRPTNSIMTMPGVNSVETITDKDGKKKVVLFDKDGVEIERRKYPGEKGYAKLKDDVAYNVERANEGAFAAKRNYYLKEQVARELADRANQDAGQVPFNKDGIPNPDYTGITASNIMDAYNKIMRIPEEQRTTEQRSLVKEFDDTYKSLDNLDTAPDAAGVKRTLCESYGVTEEEFDAAWAKDPNKRNVKEKDMCSSYNSLLSRDYTSATKTRVGTALLGGTEVVLVSRVNTEAASSADKPVYYLDPEGKIQMTTQGRLEDIRMDNRGEEADYISEQNRDAIVSKYLQEHQGEMEAFTTESLQMNEQILDYAIKQGEDVDGSLSAALRLTQDELSRRLQTEWDGLTQEQKIDKYFEGLPDERRAELVQYYSEHPLDFDKAMRYDSVHYGEIAQLLKATGEKGLEWMQKFDEYANDYEAFRKAYKEQFKEDPTERPTGFEDLDALKKQEDVEAEVVEAPKPEEQVETPVEEPVTPVQIDGNGDVIEGSETPVTPVTVDEKGDVIETEQKAPEQPEATNKMVEADEDAGLSMRQKAEAYVDAYYPELEGEARAAAIEREIERGDFENRMRYDREDGYNTEKLAAYDAAIKKAEEELAAQKAAETVEPAQEVETPTPVAEPTAEQKAAAEREAKIEEVLKDVPEDMREEVGKMYREDPAKLEEAYNALQAKKKQPIPMKKTKSGREVPDYDKATAEQAYDHLYGEGKDRERSDNLVENTINSRKERVEKAQKELEKAKAKEKKLRETATIDDEEALYDAEAATKKADDALKAAQADLEKWENVQKMANPEGKTEEVVTEEPVEEKTETPVVEDDGTLKPLPEGYRIAESDIPADFKGEVLGVKKMEGDKATVVVKDDSGEYEAEVQLEKIPEGEQKAKEAKEQAPATVSAEQEADALKIEKQTLQDEIEQRKEIAEKTDSDVMRNAALRQITKREERIADIDKRLAELEKEPEGEQKQEEVRDEVRPDTEQKPVEKTAAELEKEFNDREDELDKLEQEWDEKIKNYVAEKYPTQANTTAKTNSPEGMAERAAMNADPEYKRLLEEQKRAFDEANEKASEAYKAWQEALKKEGGTVEEENAPEAEKPAKKIDIKDALDQAKDIAKTLADELLDEDFDQHIGWRADMTEKEKIDAADMLFDEYLTSLALGDSKEDDATYHAWLDLLYKEGSEELSVYGRGFFKELATHLDKEIPKVRKRREEYRKKEAEEAKAAQEKRREISKPLMDARTKLLEAYKSGDKKAIREAQKEMTEALPLVTEKLATEFGFDPTAIVENTIEQMVNTRKKAEKGSADHKTADYIVKALRKYQKDGVKSSEGRVELNAVTLKDPVSRDYLNEIMEKEGWGEEERQEFMRMLDDAADVVLEMGKRFPRLGDWNKKEIASDKEGEIYKTMWRILNKKGQWIPNRSAFKKNGEYPWNIDLGTLCTKRESFDALVQLITEKGLAQNLGPTQIEGIKELLKDNGFLTACDICFNETKRARVISYANQISNNWRVISEALGIKDKMVGDPIELTPEQTAILNQMAGRGYKNAFKKYIPEDQRREYKGVEKAGNEIDLGLTPSMMQRIAKQMLLDPTLTGKLKPETLITTEGMDWLLRTYGGHTKINELLASAWGSGTPKPIEGFNIYDPLSWREQYDQNKPGTMKRPEIDWFFNNGGFRAQSFTDYHPMLFLDYLQMFTDLGIRRLPIHIYTKVPALVKLFGASGAKINMSLVPKMVDGVDAEHAGLKPDGNGGWEYAWDTDSFPIDDAFALRQDPRYGGNVGIIAVGLSDAHIRMMLADPTIDQVIPYHKSGMPESVQIKTGLKNATDYTDVQTTGNKPKGAKDFNFNEAVRKYGDPRKAAAEYVKWCEENGYTPKFEQFKDDPNYYKLLADFRLYDGEGRYSEQRAVNPRAILQEGWEAELENSLTDKTMQEQVKAQVGSNENLMKGVERLLGKQRMDGAVREEMVARLKGALGKDNVESLKQNDFFDALEEAYSQTMGAEKAHEKVEVLRTNDGVVYGFAQGGKIVLNENVFNAETPIHEFTHIWVKVAQRENPKLWEKGKSLLKESEEWKEVMEDELYKDIHGDENAVASEVLSRIVGRDGADYVRRLLDPESKPLKRGGVYNQIREWLNDLFKSVRSIFAPSIRNLSYEEFTKMPLKTLFDEAEAKRFLEAKNRLEKEGTLESDVEEMGYDDGGVELMLVEDPKEIERLNKEPKAVGFRNVVLNEDGTLGSPMANRLGKTGVGRRPTTPFEFNRWERSDENPDLANDKGKIDLIKPDGKSVGGVDYNPYIHIRPTTVNKQFKQAWERDNLVYIKTEYPESELNGEYRAEKAAKSVGKHPWGGGELILSRWDKPVEIVPWEEVANEWVKEFKDRGVEFDIVPPKLLPILMERGVEILPPHKGMGKACNDAYREKVLGELTDVEGDTKGFSLKNDENYWRSDRKNLPLRERARKSFTRSNGTYVEGLEEELQHLEERLRQAEKETGENDLQRVDDSSRIQSVEKDGGRGEDGLTEEFQNSTSLINRISLIKRELAARDRVRKEYKEKYGIADNGDISIENVAKMFHDFNSDKAVGELFEKVYNVLKSLKNDFRVSDNVSPKDRGAAAEYMKMAFYNWDALVRGRDNQMKAKTLLHEMIHNAATHVISSYENPVLRIFLSPSQKSAAKTLLDIYKRVLKADLRNSIGEPFYGTKTANEMVSELSNPEFREALKNIKYNKRSLWQEIKDAFKRLFGLEVSSRDVNALDEASKALDKILDSYGPINRVIRNAPRAIYDAYYKLGGENFLDVVDKGQRDDSRNKQIKSEEDGAPGRSVDDVNRELRELYHRGVLEGYDTVRDDIARLRAERDALESGENGILPPTPSASEVEQGAPAAGGAVPPSGGEPPMNEPPVVEPEPVPEQLPPTDYDRPRTAVEQAQAAAMKVVGNTEAALEQRNAARRELDASLRSLHKAMKLQKDYDATTVENVVTLAKMMYDSGLIDAEHKRQMQSLFTNIKRGTGKTPQGITTVVNDIMDAMLSSQERQISNELGKLLSTKVQKVNQSGVVTQAGLDIRGQHTMGELKEYIGKGSVIIDRRLNQLEDMKGRVREEDTERRDEIDDKILGCQLAKQFSEIDETHGANIREAKEELESLKEQYKNGEITAKEYTEQKRALENLIRSYRMSQIDALWNERNAINYVIEGSKQGARNWVEQQKEHANDVLHSAYSDMEGTSQFTQTRPSKLAKVANSSASKFVTSSLYTLDTMLRQLGSKHANGEGYLYNRFGRGWIEARDKEINDYWADREALDAKANELFGVKHFANLIDTIRKMPKMEVVYNDGGDLVSHEMDQSQLMYIYMVNKMEDGAVKLRRMGISEEDVANIKNHLDPKLVDLADWLQGDFLPSKRAGYNEVHRRLFGADMDMVDNYVPLRIDKGNLKEDVDISSQQSVPNKASTVTGGVIKRTHNTMGLDLMGTNAIDMILGHLDEMNHWKNFAEWNRDVNTLLSDRTFRNKVKNTTTIYGSGEQLWKRLKDCFFIAAGTYQPEGKDFDKAMVNIAKGVSAAKVSFRVFTATKQLLSLPVFAANTNVGYMVKNMARPADSWNWCMENLPSFKQRWKSRIAGDTRLEDTDIDWQYTHKKWVEKASKWGLTPNAFIDAMTVAVGARSVYEQRYKRYINDGYSTEQADKRAKQDATIAFNQTQQSSEKMFVAPMQIDRTALSVGASLFRNASMGYERQLVEGVRNLKHLTEKGYRDESIEFMKKQMMRDGLTDTQAQKAAERIYKRSKWRNALKVAMFSFGAQMAWNIGSKLPYMVAQGYNAIFGDDEERKAAGENALGTALEAAVHAAVGGWIEGLPFGNVVSDGMNNELNGENFFKFSPDLLPIFGDTEDVANHFDSKNKLRGVSDLINLGSQIFIGVNPQSFLDIMTGIVDVTAGRKQSDVDFGTAKEALLLTMRIMQCPQSQLDQLMIDELGMSARDAQKLTPEQVARRYAFYKAHHDVPMLWHLYNQEKQDEIVGQYEKNFNKKLGQDVKESGGSADDLKDLFFSTESTKGREKYLKDLCKKLREDEDLQKVNELIAEEYKREKEVYKGEVPGWCRSYVKRLTDIKRELEGYKNNDSETDLMKNVSLSKMKADQKAPLVIPPEQISEYDDLKATLEDEENDPDIKELAKYAKKGRSGKNRGRWYPKSKADEANFNRVYKRVKEKADRYLKHYLIYEYQVAAPLKAYSDHMSEEDKKRLNDTIAPALNGWRDPNYKILVPKWSAGKKKKK